MVIKYHKNPDPNDTLRWDLDPKKDSIRLDTDIYFFLNITKHQILKIFFYVFYNFINHFLSYNCHYEKNKFYGYLIS